MASSKDEASKMSGGWLQEEIQEEEALINRSREKVIRALWERRLFDPAKDPFPFWADRRDPKKSDYLVRFLKESPPAGFEDKIESLVNNAIKEDNFEKFYSLFNYLDSEQIKKLDFWEGLRIISVDHEPNIDKSALIKNEKTIDGLQQYMRDSKFSGIVSLSTSGENSPTTIMSENLKSSVPFAIHSVGKVLTGVLAVTMMLPSPEGGKPIITEDLLDKKPLELDESVLNVLREKAPKVFAHLKNTTLRQVMLHQSGFGDYLNKYSASIRESLDAHKDPAKIKGPEDFLIYADDEITPLEKGETKYSNIGLLLVGLSIQHHYNKNKPANEQLSYDEILEKHLLSKAGMKISVHAPKDAYYNKGTIAEHVEGGPAGGYWTTVEEMKKFSEYLKIQWDQNPEFKRLVINYGGEFYKKDSQEISHGGGFPGLGSAHFLTSLNNGNTVVIVSNQQRAAGILNLVGRKMFEPQLKIDEKLGYESREEKKSKESDNMSMSPSPLILRSYNKTITGLGKEVSINKSDFESLYKKTMGEESSTLDAKNELDFLKKIGAQSVQKTITNGQENYILTFINKEDAMDFKKNTDFYVSSNKPGHTNHS